MIQQKILDQKIKQFEVEEFVSQNLKGVGLSSVKLQMTPLGEKIVVYASRPGLVVGKKGQYIRKLTNTLKKKFNLENPQIEIGEVSNPNLDPKIVAERIANTLERFGVNRFKGIGHKTMEDVMGAGARGVEIIISGKVPSSRAKRWRFYQGYLKKCGDVAVTQVKTAYAQALLKTGTIGIQVRIMTGDVKLPDDMKVTDEIPPMVVEQTEEKEEEPAKKKRQRKKSQPPAQQKENKETEQQNEENRA
ncbi:MAG: 30S ribosomal protein S3 [Candidatus Woesearchaeota archaeon]